MVHVTLSLMFLHFTAFYVSPPPLNVPLQDSIIAAILTETFISSTVCVYVLPTILRIGSKYFPKLH
jgi:hypothetical protein